MMGLHGVTAGLPLSHVTAADGTAEYQSRFTCCLLSCFLLYRYQIPPRECQAGAGGGVQGEKSHKVGGWGMSNAGGALSPGKEEHPCVRMKQRWDGQGEEEMKVRQADEELKRREAFIYIFFDSANKGGADRDGTKNVPRPL